MYCWEREPEITHPLPWKIGCLFIKRIIWSLPGFECVFVEGRDVETRGMLDEAIVAIGDTSLVRIGVLFFVRTSESFMYSTRESLRGGR